MNGVTIVSYRPEHAGAFDSLNRAWLVGHGLLESADEPHLRTPDQTIIAAGGQIFVAIEEGRVIGTCAAVPHGPGEFELVKLAVAPPAQGRGIGTSLVECTVNFVRQQGAQRITLLSSSRLGAALKLYERVGFKYAALPTTNPYATADVYMTLDLA
jgi:ribosomal protein S18 acetylase RimI-like enzyme